MPSFTCTCGHEIQDTPGELPYKGEIIQSKRRAEFHDWIARMTAAFIAADRSGKRAEWLRAFSSEHGLLDDLTTDEEVVAGIVTVAAQDCSLPMFQCVQCGRLHVSTRPGEWAFVEFVPDQPLPPPPPDEEQSSQPPTPQGPPENEFEDYG